MTTKDDTRKPESGNPMLEWLSGTMANASLDREMKRCQALASDMQSLATETYGGQMKVFSAINERVAASVPEFGGCRQPPDVVAAASKLYADLLEIASQQARIWADRSQTLRGHLAAADDGFVPQSGDAAASALAAEKARAAAEPARRKSA